MRKGANCATLVLPRFKVNLLNGKTRRDLPVCCCDSGYTIRGLNLTLVNSYIGQLSWCFIPSDSMRLYSFNIDISSKVTRKIAKVCSLFDDGASTLGSFGQTRQLIGSKYPPYLLIPPIWFQNLFVCTCITGKGGHDCEVVILDGLLYHLYRL